jgi:hypothetical protein
MLLIGFVCVDKNGYRCTIVVMNFMLLTCLYLVKYYR